MCLAKTLFKLAILFVAVGVLSRPVHAAPAPKQDNIITNSIGMKLALIPAGEFLMGSPETDKDAQPDEKPQHKVKITKPFYMGVHAVTVGQFRAFVKDTNYKTAAENASGAWKTITPGGRVAPGTNKHNWANTGIEQTDDYPVVIVDYPDAEEFCKWLSKADGKSYRLPTEAEWEYACRGGTMTRWSSGDDREALVEYANIQYDSFPKYARSNNPKAANDGWLFMAPVGKFKPNPCGLYDMHGNVWQWCADWYAEDYYKESSEADPSGPAQGTIRVIRGGAWLRGPLDCRSANRFGLSGATSLWVGFRVVRDAPAEAKR